MTDQTWPAPGLLGALVSTRNRYPRIVGVYAIQRVNSRYIVALPTRIEDGKRVVSSADTVEFRVSDGRRKGTTEYSGEQLTPMDAPAVQTARRHRRIRAATEDLLVLLNNADKVRALTGEDFAAAIDMAGEIAQLAAEAVHALKIKAAYIDGTSR